MIPAADLFAGLGGFTEGAVQTMRVDVQFAANHWPAAVKWHRANHPDVEHMTQDLAQCDFRVLPDLCDGILIASPACQGFSEAGQPGAKGTGGNGQVDRERVHQAQQADRNTTWAVLAAADTVRPQTIIVENVPRWLRWGIFGAWRSVLEALEYHVEVHTLNASHFGSPQDRERVVVTANLGRALRLEPGHPRNARSIADCLESNAAEGSFPAWAAIEAKPERMRWRMRKAQREAGSLCAWNNVSEASGRPLDGPFPTLTRKGIGQLYLLDGDQCRLYSVRELARSMSFPDHYQLPTQRTLAGQLLGNAIDVRLARSIIEQAVAA